MLELAAMSKLEVLGRRLSLGVVFLCASMLLVASVMPLSERTEQVRAFTRDIEFDYVSWVLNALRLKFNQSALGIGDYLVPDARRQLVLDYLTLVAQIQQAEGQLAMVYADPEISDPQVAAAPFRAQLEQLYAQRERMQPIAESVLQNQVSYVVDQLGLSLGGQPMPPILYHSTPLPLALIVSPRDVIRQDENVSLIPDFPVEGQIALEEQVDRALDVSSLVVNIGGVGLYPTMVQQTSYLDWLGEVVAHEWVHNYLSLRPLGVNYMTSPELRVINETVAAIAGKEIGLVFLGAFYPELLPPPPPPQDESVPAPPEPPVFDFRAEMHETRLTVDQLLAEGKIEEAEEYMEARRVVFWENGYRHLRKLNQAYFAFHGAYADQPGGAAGAIEDPVGSVVRQLRAQSSSLAAFLKRISWISSFEQLEQAVEEGTG